MSTYALSRRTFLRSTASAAAVLSVSRPGLGALGANERIRVAHMGTGGQGTYHVREVATNQKTNNTETVAVCDVVAAHRERAAKTAGNSPKQFNDFRRIIDMKDADALFVTATDHWHAIPTLRAIEAGMDVYVEKPIGHTIQEGRMIVDAEKKHRRVVQVGQQQRSHSHWIHAVTRIQAGEIGQVTTVNTWNAWNLKELRSDLGTPPDTDPPPGVDYDMWLGPAQKRPFNPARFNRYWYFFWEYGGGMVPGWGVHLFDIVMWAMGYRVNSVSAVGGKYVFKDLRDTPDTVEAVFDCGSYVMTYSLRHTNGWRPHGDMDHGIEFIGTEGVLQVNRKGFEMYHEADRASRKPYYTEKATVQSAADHHRNFFDCIRSRKKTVCDAQAGHIAAIPSYLANISYRVNRQINWNAEKETIVSDLEAAKLLTKPYRAPWHL